MLLAGQSIARRLQKRAGRCLQVQQCQHSQIPHNLRFSTSAHPPDAPPTGTAKLTNRRLILLHGHETPKFLQGIVTNNIGLQTESQPGCFAAFLTAQGKVLNDVFAYPTLGSEWHQRILGDESPGFLVEVDSDACDGLLKHLKRHKLRSKFTLRALDPGELDVHSVWRDDERWTPHSKAKVDGAVLTMTDSRAPGMGQRLLLPASTRAADVAGLEEVPEAPLSAYTIRRYLRGVPEGQTEIPREEDLPMNVNLDIMGGIDFKKGCYVGQELTIRTHHTGVVRRRVLPVALYKPVDRPPDHLTYDTESLVTLEGARAEIKRDNQRRRGTGRVIASMGNVGLAICRLEQMTDLTVSGEGVVFSADDRFVAQSANGTEVGVKAFVPDWIRGRIRAPKIQRRVE